MNADPFTPASNRPANRLAREKSPYLLQHQHNPVDWYPWGEEAFGRARSENKPIFLSIGYSTCHWCHVMERESFEDPDVARLLNEHFVSIKVDREERPDVDKIYMTFVQATTGQGGWPLSAFLTPDLKPFFGGTYFPPENRHGRPGFAHLLHQIAQLWQQRRPDLLASADGMHARLGEAMRQGLRADPNRQALGPEVLHHAASVFKSVYDARDGGFGGAPKFPQPGIPRFLLAYGRRFNDAEAVRMVLHTCDAMARGGLHDQLGGGFARYSVDAQWLVPHFEKMLYDNAQLLQLYLDAFVLTGEPRHAEVAHGILRYLRRDMTHPEGGFYSAEDADSEGHEGKFYCWTLDEVHGLLSPAEAEVAVRFFGLTPQGNFVDHSHPAPLPNQNVLSVVQPELGAADQPLLESAKQKLFAARSRRVRPHLDDKVLASWNGLMLGAVARAAAVLGEADCLRAARQNLDFLKARLWDAPSRTLYHRWRDGERDQVQLLEAYAFVLAGVLDLYEVTLASDDLQFAVDLAEVMLQKFFDPDQGGFWQSEARDLIFKVKEDYDGAEPSGNSVAVHSLLRLGRMTERADFSSAAERTLGLFAQRLREQPQAVPCLLAAFDGFLADPLEVVIAGAPADAPLPPLVRAAHSVYAPQRLVLGTAGPVRPFARSLPPGNSGQPLAYVCLNRACRPPTADPALLADSLRSP